MITLSRDKQLIRLRSWSDLEEEPGFRVEIDPTKEKPESIIGHYTESEEIICGLSSCHTRHKKGYVIVTNAGHVTNIGKDCGKSRFGVSFEDMSRRFDNWITEQENREALWNFVRRLDDTVAEMQSVLD